MAVLRHAAMIWGMLPQRTCERSASNVTSRTNATCFQSAIALVPRSASAWVSRARAQARDAIDHFHPFLARFLEHDLTSQLKDLREPGPIAVADEGLTRREIALLYTPMAKIDCPRRALAVANGRERQDQRDIGPPPRRVLFDDHDIISSLVYNRLRDVALGQEGIHRDNESF